MSRPPPFPKTTWYRNSATEDYVSWLTQRAFYLPPSLVRPGLHIEICPAEIILRRRVYDDRR
jgi:hypothetical protein